MVGHGLTVKWYFVKCSNPIGWLEKNLRSMARRLLIAMLSTYVTYIMGAGAESAQVLSRMVYKAGIRI